MYRYINILPEKIKSLDYINEIIDLVDSNLGSLYFDNNFNSIDMAWCCFDKDNIIAFAATSSSDDSGILKCVVVDSKFRHKGISSKLTELRLEYLKNKGYKTVRSFAWVYPDHSCISCKTLEKYGFYEVEDRSDVFKTNCPYCVEVCSCVARDFEKKMI